jgi:hypothetical protein
MRDVATTGLKQHLSQVRKRILKPYESLLTLYLTPRLALRKRNNRRADYEKYVYQKKHGKKVDPRIAERADEYDVLNESIKSDLPKLSKCNHALKEACLAILIDIQTRWWQEWVNRLSSVLEFRDRNLEIVDIMHDFKADFDLIRERAENLRLVSANPTRYSLSTSDSTTSVSTRARTSTNPDRGRGRDSLTNLKTGTDEATLSSGESWYKVRPNVRTSSSTTRDRGHDSITSPGYGSTRPSMQSSTSDARQSVTSTQRGISPRPIFKLLKKSSTSNLSSASATPPVSATPVLSPRTSVQSQSPSNTQPPQSATRDRSSTGSFQGPAFAYFRKEPADKINSGRQSYSSQHSAGVSNPSASFDSANDHWKTSDTPPELPRPTFTDAFSSALPSEFQDPGVLAADGRAVGAGPAVGSKQFEVLYLAASVDEFHIESTKWEAGYPYLMYNKGEVCILFFPCEGGIGVGGGHRANRSRCSMLLVRRGSCGWLRTRMILLGRSAGFGAAIL